MSFNILDYRHNLTIIKETRSELNCECPVCEAGNFKIDARNGKYYAFGCSCTDSPQGKRAVKIALGWESPHQKNGVAKDNWTELAKQYREKKQRKREAKQKEQRARWLSVEERDENIRIILSQLKLSQEHKEILRRRGFTDEQIEAADYRSVKRWQELEGIDARLPGINNRGNLNNATDGILIPIPDVNGRYVGLRINDPDYQSHEDSAKYKFLSSGKRGFEPHLQNGEMFLAVYGRELGGEVVGITEGYEYKPYIASIKLGIPIIGGGGSARVNSSPETLKTTLEKLNPKTIIIYGDSGSALNENIVKSFEDTCRLVTDWGYQVLIADWGQLHQKHKGDKKLGDIDEISQLTLESIQYISPNEFFEQAKNSLFKLKTKRNWESMKKFTPDIKINKEYLEDENFSYWQDGTILFIKSGLGTGKSARLAKVQKDLCEGGIKVGYRNTLELQWCNDPGLDSGYYHLHDHILRDSKSVYLLRNAEGKVALCVNSIKHIHPHHVEGKNIIIDEVMSVIKHTLFSGTIKYEELRSILDRLTLLLRTAKKVICLDGMLADWVVKRFKNLCPEKRCITIENTFKGRRPKIYLLNGAFVGDNVKKNEVMGYYKELLDNCERPVIATDQQVLAEALDNLFKAQGLQGIRIDSKTIYEPLIKKFLSNCNGFIEETKPDYLIYSPSAESGLNISIKDYFTEFYGFFCGVLDADSIIQMIMRIRDPQLPRFVFVKSQSVSLEQVGRRSPLAEHLNWQYQQMFTKELNLAFENHIEIISSLQLELEKIKNDPYFQTATQIKAMWNYEQWNLRECVRILLENNGHQVELLEQDLVNDGFDIDDYKLAKQEIREAKKEVQIQNSSDIFNAGDDYVGKSREKQLRYDASWSERCKLEKARILDRLPGLQESEIWNQDFIYQVKYQQPRTISQLENRYLLFNPDTAKKLTQLKFKRLLERVQDTGQLLTPWRLKNQYLMIRALINLEIDKWLAGAFNDDGSLNHDFFEQEYTACHPIIENLVKTGKTKPVRQALGRSPGKDPIKYVQSILRLVGCELKAKQKKIDGQPLWVYRFKLEDFINTGDKRDRHIPQILGFIDTKFLAILEKSKNQGAKVDETYTGIDFKPVTDPPILYTNIDQSVTATNLTDKETEPIIKLKTENHSDLTQIVTESELGKTNAIDKEQDVNEIYHDPYTYQLNEEVLVRPYKRTFSGLVYEQSWLRGKINYIDPRNGRYNVYIEDDGICTNLDVYPAQVPYILAPRQGGDVYEVR